MSKETTGTGRDREVGKDNRYRQRQRGEQRDNRYRQRQRGG